MSDRLRYAYDIECFPNLFTVTFVNVNDEADMHVFCIGLDRDDFRALRNFLNNNITLIGYNNHSYDDPMLRYILTYNGEFLLDDLSKISGKLVSDYYKDEEILSLRYPRKKIFNWDSIDLMKILAFDKLGISLKQTSINLKWHKIQDMPVSIYRDVEPYQLDTILSYNLNDTLITKKLYEEITPLREMRDELSTIYGINLSSASDSKIANLLLEKFYSKESGINVKQLRELRTPREKVYLRECIGKFVKFKTPQLQELFKSISSTIVYNYNGYKYSEKLFFANCIFALGIGGLHSEDAPEKFVSDDEYLIQDMDVASYYPNLIINNEFYPKHLGKTFIKVLKKITEERIAAKKSGDKVKANGLKITINSIFGKLGSETFWLLDAKQMLSTTLTGQLGLLMLIEDLYLNGIEVISANTDGIVCKIKRSLLDKYYEIAENWQKATNLELEFTPYKKYIRRDVNSYITEKENGSTKEKGAFLKEVDLKKAYHMPIVAKALCAYFIGGTSIKKTLEDCKDIMEFCISQKSGSDFGIELHTSKGIEHLQKTNRFFISKKGGSLIKRKSSSNSMTGLYVGKLVTILNDYDSSIPFENYNVDLNFYEKEVMKIVDEIEPPQMTLFELTDFRNGGIIKADIKTKPVEIIEERLSISELNKLGRNQFSKKLESIVLNQQTIDNISPRYVYVIDFDVPSMSLNLYCLEKGTYQNIKVDKRAYNKAKLESGKLIYCDKFAKLKDEYILSEYRITEKIEEQKDKLL